MRPLQVYGLLCVCTLVTMGSAEVFSEGPRLAKLASAPVVRFGRGTKVGQLAAVEGTVAETEGASGLAAGVEERFKNGKYGGWETASVLKRTFEVKADGGEKAKVEWPAPRVHGTTTIVEDPRDEDHRWVGLHTGDRICCVGIVTRPAPLSLRSTLGCHGGSLADYRRFANDERLRLWTLAFSVYAVIGVLLLLITRIATWADRPAR